MNVKEFISGYRNHPILFIGTGISLRYLKKSYNWDGLLKKISFDLTGNDEFYYDIKSSCEFNNKYRYDLIATKLEEKFNSEVSKNRNGPLGFINDIFYRKMEEGINVSRMKLYISELLKKTEIKESFKNELSALKRARKNIGSIITTNYDTFLEDFLEFSTLIGNDILLSNPYGSIYKIHGCVNEPTKIIINEDDYKSFSKRYELIRAQLLSLFIHNPIIFLGYSVSDENIKSLLRTIFTYVEPNSDHAHKIRQNFLLVEFDEGSQSTSISAHDIDLEGFSSTIRINKMLTDDFSTIYEQISELTLPITAMDIRKVQNIVKEIYSGGEIKVTITEDLDSLKNSDKILAIGSEKTIKYQYLTIPEMISKYFNIIEESNYQVLELINKQKIQSNQYFPVFGFSKICKSIKNEINLKKQQKNKINEIRYKTRENLKTNHTTIQSILNDESIANSYKTIAIIWSVSEGLIDLSELESYLKKYTDKTKTEYKQLLCTYDLYKYRD